MVNQFGRLPIGLALKASPVRLLARSMGTRRSLTSEQNQDATRRNRPFLRHRACVILNSISILRSGVSIMEWTTPQHEEIDLNCEISSYANAEL